MLSIFPFEKGWYAARAKDFRVEFVGHPLIDRFADEKGKSDGGTKLLLLPGSRERELKKHLPVMMEAAGRLRAEEGVAVEMVLPNEQLASLAGRLVDLKGIEIVVGNLAECLRNARAAIASSGTVTMECAYFGVPTVVIYKTSWSTYALGRRFIKVKYLAMPNLLAEEEVFPEFIQEGANGESIYRAAKELLNKEERRSVIKTQLQRVITSLGEPGASGRAAKAILSLDR
jgi:lipid-A-disaccharide synthase